MKIEAVDLFCGAGGLTAGLKKVGIKVKAGYDTDGLCSYAYEKNNRAVFRQKDVKTLKGEEVSGWYSEGVVRLLAGCAPCQPFSSYNQGKDTTKDEKWPLLYSFLRLIEEVRPELVTMENVSDVTKHKVYNDFVSALDKLGYNVSASTVRCEEYGLPQVRRRHVLLASRLGEIALIPPTHKDKFVTVKDAIGGLQRIQAGQVSKQDPLHRASKLSDINLRRIKFSKPGGSWKDWPEDLIADCHKKSTGKTYPSVYGRMQWEKPAPTMTTLCFGYGNGRFGHPAQNRAISLREAAILQSFPESYKFCPDDEINFRTVGRMIGNAVPVALGKVIGKSFVNHLRSVHE